MSHADRSLVRRTSRSEQPKYASLVLSKPSFLDTLVIHRSSGLPVYATMTQAGRTTVYVVDTRMTIQKIFALNWDKGSKPNGREPSLEIHGKVVPLDQVFPTRKRTFWPKATDHTYSYGHSTYQWAEQEDPWFTSMTNYINTVCYRRAPSTSSSPSSSPSASPMLCTSAVGKIPVATIVGSNIRHRHKIQIDIHARDLLEQTPGPDGLTELDHVFLGALLVSTPPFDERSKPMSADWSSESELQGLLWSNLERPTRHDELPIYAAHGFRRTGSLDLPPYTSQERI